MGAIPSLATDYWISQKPLLRVVNEYGRTLWEQQGGVLAFEDFMKIATTQIEKENMARRTTQIFFFADTSPLTTLFYCYEYHRKSRAELEKLSLREYDYTFLCVPDFPMVQDGTRVNEEFRARLHAWYLQMLNSLKIKYDLLYGDIEARRNQVLRRIGARL